MWWISVTSELRCVYREGVIFHQYHGVVKIRQNDHGVLGKFSLASKTPPMHRARTTIRTCKFTSKAANKNSGE